MNNFILITRTYAETDPESVESGEFSDTGLIAEKEAVTFRELVDLMHAHHHASQYPNNGETHVWYSTDFFTDNFVYGIDREESIHFHIDNTENAAKYWRLAAKFAGHIK